MLLLGDSIAESGPLHLLLFTPFYLRVEVLLFFSRVKSKYYVVLADYPIHALSMGLAGIVEHHNDLIRVSSHRVTAPKGEL